MSFDDAFQKFPILTTKRLILREITMDDTEKIFHLFNSLETTDLFSPPKFDCIEDAKNFIAKSKKGYFRKWFIDWWITLKDNNLIIGSIRLGPFEMESKATIGYFISGEYNGKGIMTEAIRVVVNFAFEVLGLHRIEATDHPENHASSRILEKLGFKKEGLLRMHQWRNDKWSDSLLWSILRSDFES